MTIGTVQSNPSPLPTELGVVPAEEELELPEGLKEVEPPEIDTELELWDTDPSAPVLVTVVVLVEPLITTQVLTVSFPWVVVVQSPSELELGELKDVELELEEEAGTDSDLLLWDTDPSAPVLVTVVVLVVPSVTTQVLMLLPSEEEEVEQDSLEEELELAPEIVELEELEELEEEAATDSDLLLWDTEPSAPVVVTVVVLVVPSVTTQVLMLLPSKEEEVEQDWLVWASAIATEPRRIALIILEKEVSIK
jgi:hypothetical protein